MLTVVLAAVFTYSFWPQKEDTQLPVQINLTLEQNPQKTIKKALLKGDDVTIRVMVEGNELSNDKFKEEATYISYGRVPPRTKIKLLNNLRVNVAMFTEALEKIGEPKTLEDQVKWHEANVDLIRAMATMDVVEQDEAYIADRVVDLTGHTNIGMTLGVLYLDEATGLAIDKPLADSTKKGTYLTPSTPCCVVINIENDKYYGIGFHTSQAIKLKKEVSTTNAIIFNSFDYIERNRRAAEYNRLKAELKALPLKSPEMREHYANLMHQQVPRGLIVRGDQMIATVHSRMW